MKLFLSCIFMSIISFSTYPAAPDSSKTIYIITKDDDVAAFRTIGKIFNSSGYNLEDSEEALMTVTTEIMNKSYGPFNLGRMAIQLKAEINMTDTITVIKLTGHYLEKEKMNITELEPYFDKNSNTIINTCTPGAVSQKAWDYMMEIAQKYRNGNIRLK